MCAAAGHPVRSDPDPLALGSLGLGRREIAARLGLTLAELAEREADEPTFAAAMARAAEAERAWWDGIVREGLAAGARFNHGAWRWAMAARFGVDPCARAAEARAGKRDARWPGGVPPWELDEDPVRFDIPDNGKERRPRRRRV